MNTINYQLSANEAESASLDLEKSFANRFSTSLLLTLFVAGYVWTLAVSYPALIMLPVMFCAISLAGHFVMALQLIQRLQTLDDNSKNKALVWVPFIGLAYGLPAVMNVAAKTPSYDSDLQDYTTEAVENSEAA